ncbi:MFS transporter [Lentilactobacillus kosonis]|uniref:Arabinose efflux permease n=1 Tax=Lentilactobacillus kosonis TaxID=2810561 RepID=A0A401FI82_9LACO|nr:MFS transporter [Lentilactobacillus kosonis]GAY72062.1 arabinose efflux permease [Lentilactobacillus kosonis]
MQSFKTRSFILVAIGFILGMSEFIMVGILNDLASSFHVGIASVGLLVTLFAIVYAIATPILTIMVGSHRLYRVMILLLIIFIAGNVLTAIAPNYAILTISRILTAIVSGITVSIAITFSAVIAPREKRAWLVSWVFSGFSIASVFGVPLGTWMSGTFGWRSVFWLIVIISIVFTILFVLSLPRDVRQGKMDHFTQQLSIFKDKRILLGILLPTLNLAGVYVVYTYLRPIIVSGINFPESFVTPILFVYGFASLASNQVSGRIANYDGLKTIEKVYILQIVALIALPLLFRLSWLALAALVILGFTMYLQNSPMQLFYLEVAETDYPQSMVMASSLNSIFSNLGIAIGSATGGVMVSSLGLSSLGFGGAVYTVLALVILITLNHVRKIK